MASHTFHFLGAAFGLLGLLGFADREFHRAPARERTAFVVSFIGTILFAATGMLTAFWWPLLATHAPHVTELNGPFFAPPHPTILITTFSYSLGHIFFGFALWRAGLLAGWGLAVLALGGTLLVVPPAPISPLPWVIFPIGGVAFGAGLAAMGLSVRTAGAPRAIAAI